MVDFEIVLKDRTRFQDFSREMKGCHRKTFQAGDIGGTKHDYGQRPRVSLQMTHLEICSGQPQLLQTGGKNCSEGRGFLSSHRLDFMLRTEMWS